jgi:hypothetical protein
MNKYLRKRERAKRRSVLQQQKEERCLIKSKVKLIIKTFTEGDDLVRICPPYSTTEEQSKDLWDAIAKDLYKKIPHFWYLWTADTYYIAFTPLNEFKKYYPKEEVVNE